MVLVIVSENSQLTTPLMTDITVFHIIYNQNMEITQVSMTDG